MLHLGCLISRATGDSCVMLESTKTADRRLRPWLFAMHENAVWDINHAEMLHASHTCTDARGHIEQTQESPFSCSHCVHRLLDAPLLTKTSMERLEVNLY